MDAYAGGYPYGSVDPNSLLRFPTSRPLLLDHVMIHAVLFLSYSNVVGFSHCLVLPFHVFQSCFVFHSCCISILRIFASDNFFSVFRIRGFIDSNNVFVFKFCRVFNYVVFSDFVVFQSFCFSRIFLLFFFLSNHNSRSPTGPCKRLRRTPVLPRH